MAFSVHSSAVLLGLVIVGGLVKIFIGLVRKFVGLVDLNFSSPGDSEM